MLNLKLNRRNLNKLCNGVFDRINYFFLGNSGDQEYSPVIDEEFTSTFSHEWDLHQGHADILIKDIRVGFGWIFPPSFYEAINKIKKDILFFFYSDMIDDEEPSLFNKLPLSGYSDLTIKIKAKIISASGTARQNINLKVLSFNDGWKALIRKLELILRLEQETKTFYLLGSFLPVDYEGHNNNQTMLINIRDKINLKNLFSFHKRN